MKAFGWCRFLTIPWGSVLTTPALLGQRYPRAVSAVRCKYPVETCQVDPHRIPLVEGIQRIQLSSIVVIAKLVFVQQLCKARDILWIQSGHALAFSERYWIHT